MAGSKAKGNRKGSRGDLAADQPRLAARDARKLARRLANGLDYLSDEEQDALAQEAVHVFLNDPEGPFREIEDEKKRRFLRALSVTGVYAAAGRLAGVHPTCLYIESWENDDLFQKALKRAKLAGADALIGEAYRRGVEGVEKATGWYRGEPGGVVREYSDHMLSKLLHASEKGDLFRDRVDVRQEISIDLDRIADRLPGPVIAAMADGIPLAVALTEFVARSLEAAKSGALPPGRDVTPGGHDGP